MIVTPTWFEIEWKSADLVAAASAPRHNLLRTPGYTFGLGFAVRREAGIAGVPGSAGEYTWDGAFGTYVWIDPQVVG